MALLACANASWQQDRDPNDFTLLVAHNDVVVRELAVVGLARLLEVQVEDVGFRVKADPELARGQAEELRHRLHDLL